MANPIQSKSILAVDRRQLLATAAAISTSRILPKAERAKAGRTAEAVMVPTTPELEAAPLNVCRVTAQRIEEIAARNRIRQEAWTRYFSTMVRASTRNQIVIIKTEKTL